MKTPSNKLSDADIDALLRSPLPPAPSDFEQRLQRSIEAGPGNSSQNKRPAIIRLFSASLMVAAAAVAIFLGLPAVVSTTQPVQEASIIEEEIFVLCDYLENIDPETFEAITYYASVH